MLTALAFEHRGQPGGLRPPFQKVGALVLSRRVMGRFAEPSLGTLNALHAHVAPPGVVVHSGLIRHILSSVVLYRRLLCVLLLLWMWFMHCSRMGQFFLRRGGGIDLHFGN